MDGVQGSIMFVSSTVQPTSPPATPSVYGKNKSTAVYSSASHINTSGQQLGTQSPPPENLFPIGQGPLFSYSRGRPGDASQPSTASRLSISKGSPISSGEIDLSDEVNCSDSVSERNFESNTGDEYDGNNGDDDDDESDSESIGDDSQQASQRGTSLGISQSFEILEIAGSYDNIHSGIEVRQPDNIEDAESDKEESAVRMEKETGDMTSKFGMMQCNGEEDSGEERRRRRRWERKKKRWSAGVYKRTHSQSIGSDTDLEDVEAMDAQDVGSSARRLRRRVRGPGDRSSLTFDDLSNRNSIVEVEEPFDGRQSSRPLSFSIDADHLGLELPLWEVEDVMEVFWSNPR